MADSNKRQTAELARINYRKQLFRNGAGLSYGPPTLVEKVPGDADGLMPIKKVGAPLKITIPVWPNRPDENNDSKDTLYLEWRIVTVPESEYVEFHDEEVPGSVVDFPLPRTIPLHLFANFEGRFEIRYRVKAWNTPTIFDSDPAPVTIDRTGPIRPGVPESIIVKVPLVTTEVLERDGGVPCEIPDFVEDKKDFVTLAVALFDVPPKEAPPPEDLAYLGTLPENRLITIPKELVNQLGSKYQYIVYFLYDKAGNRSDMPFPTEMQVALGDLPDGLQSPEVPLAIDDLIDRADAAFPTTVRIREYDNWLAADGIVIQWGLNTLTRTSVGAHLPFPLDITVPWLHLQAEYDFDAGGVQSTDVDYQVLRGDYPTASPGNIQVNVDLAIPGPENPGPEPTNPKLGLVRFQSSSDSATRLTVADFGEKAEGHIKLVDILLDELLKDDVLTLYWNGTAVSSTPYVIKGDELVDTEITMDILWEDIEKVPVMDQLPMHYTLTRTGFSNPQESERTYIDVVVEKVDLPEPTFPNIDEGYPMNCNALVQKDGEWGIIVHIPKSKYLEKGVDVIANWQTYGKDKVTELPDTDLPATLTVSEEEEREGIDWFIPHVKHLKPTYDTGDQYGWGKVIYSIEVRGEDISSELVEVMIAVFEDGGHCNVTRP